MVAERKNTIMKAGVGMNKVAEEIRLSRNTPRYPKEETRPYKNASM
jgi:hypothetical protein